MVPSTYASFPRCCSRILLAAGLTLAALTVQPLPAAAQQQSRSTSTQSPWEVIRSFKLRADPVEPLEFVRKSRPPENELQYLPLGSPRQEPAKPVMSYEEIRAREASLDNVRIRHDALSGRHAPVVKLKSVAYAPRPPVVKRKPQKCLLTCVISAIM